MANRAGSAEPDGIRILLDEPPVMVTGAAGFIGFHLASRLLAAGVPVVGVDDLTPYYDPALKAARLARLTATPGFSFERVDLADAEAAQDLFERRAPRRVAHLAAQAGVRHSIEHPLDYGRSNLAGFLNVLEGCRATKTAHLVYASTSSVYGGNRRMPFSASDGANHPVSLYAATKKANEAMAHSYAHLYRLPCTGLRFFTVYGPWGRPDMAYWLFSEAILEGRPIDVFNEGRMARDFTYVEDLVEALAPLLAKPPSPDPDFDALAPDPASSSAPHRIYNIGNDRPEQLTDMIAALEEALGRKAVQRLLPMQPGDMQETWADIAPLASVIGYRPRTRLREGLKRFAEWYLWWREVGRTTALSDPAESPVARSRVEDGATIAP